MNWFHGFSAFCLSESDLTKVKKVPGVRRERTVLGSRPGQSVMVGVLDNSCGINNCRKCSVVSVRNI